MKWGWFQDLAYLGIPQNSVYVHFDANIIYVNEMIINADLNYI